MTISPAFDAMGNPHTLWRDLLDLSSIYRYYLPAAIVLWFIVPHGNRKHLPPSPGRTLPIIGHLHLMPRSKVWPKLTEWSREFGSIYRINLAGTEAVVLGTHKAAADLLDRRSVNYSDRPRSIVASELMGGGMIIGLIDPNRRWKQMRRASHEAMGSTAANNYRGMQEAEAYILSCQLLQTPADWDDHLQRASNSLMLSVIYGLPPRLNSLDPNIRRTNEFVSGLLTAAAPGAYLVEYFTWMKHLPRWICPWRRFAENYFEEYSIYFGKQIAEVEARMKQGTQPPCVASTFIENRQKFGMTDQEAAWAATSLYAVGGESTSGQMAWMLLAMAMHPDIQKKAQAQIDRVVGRDRMPALRDIPQLPYVSALVTEIMRWHGIAPLGVPHRLNTDDYYEGFYLPKDTVVIANVWALNHDPEVWGPDADDFRPERHLDDDGQLKKPLPDTHDESHVSFGFGRRICVGRAVAQNSLLIQTACILWATNVSFPKDNSGNPIIPDPSACIDTGLVVRPEPFSCEIRPRSSDVGTVIRHSLDAKGISF